ncbi:hypothetical protein FDECE_5047 [Fusarium decemcellulare]|uniref:Uncharacterized protein n=1 Tax=Fusarium decemcellulare TaxID=57161 RepID=A0ACC1RM28_9HYPO|nr:hypothetical protein FDECE_5047 [Fusarium decemcellulare]KAJ3522465.1 hypothetical protein NM208_g12848 [Fusarium decemcellulare]
MLRSSLLLALSGLAAAAKSHNFSTNKAHQKSLLFPGTGSEALIFSLTGTCSSGEKECDSGCIELSAQCCNKGIGAYCEDGYYCSGSGCCPDGEICSGTPSGCQEGKEICGSYCIPEGKVCCDTGYCDEGESCTSDGQCSTGGSSGSGGSGGSGGNNCYSFQEECDDGCMPKGSVCCGNGKYCFSGETCLNDGTCRFGSGSGGGGGSSGDDDDDSSSTTDDSDRFTFTEAESSTAEFTFDEPSFTAPSFTAPTLDAVPTIDDDLSTLSSRPLPTGPVSGGDDGDSSSSSDNSDGAGIINVPIVLVGLVALIPLLL